METGSNSPIAWANILEVIEFEVWCAGEFVAGASGSRGDAWREALHYAAQYSADGPVEIYEVTRTLVADSDSLSELVG